MLEQKRLSTFKFSVFMHNGNARLGGRLLVLSPWICCKPTTLRQGYGIAIGEERGKVEGIAIGEERGIALGKSQALSLAQAVAQMRKRVMDIVIARFLSLVGLANGVVAAISNSDLLLDLLVKLAQAQSTEDAEQALLNAQAVQES